MAKRLEKLHSYRQAIDLARMYVQISTELKQSHHFGVADQIERAAVSVASNLAEGANSGSDKLFKRYINTAIGSSYELIAQSEIIEGLVDPIRLKSCVDEVNKLIAGLYNLRSYLSESIESKGQ